MEKHELTPHIPGEEITPDAPINDPVAAAIEVRDGGEPKVPKAKNGDKKKAGLPDMKDVNPMKITRSVLTNQGWVVPAEKPKNS
jgi:hypothetical protein